MDVTCVARSPQSYRRAKVRIHCTPRSFGLFLASALKHRGKGESSVDTGKRQNRVYAAVFAICCVLILAAGSVGRSQQRQAVDHNGAPLFKVDPFWPKPLPNRWSMQQVTGIFVDQNDHIWFLNRAAKADADEVGGENNRIDCCIQGPELIELDQEGNAVHSWGGPAYHPLWPTALQTVVVDRRGFVWVAGTAPQDSILKFTKDASTSTKTQARSTSSTGSVSSCTTWRRARSSAAGAATEYP